MKKKKILLTGASGSVGFRVFEELLSHQDEFNLTLFLRKSKKNINMFKPYFGEVIIKWGNLENYDDVLKAVEGNDIVIHLAAIIPPKSEENAERTRLVNVEGTRNIINAMLEQENKPKIIYTSSIAIYGDRIKNPYIKITDPLDKRPEDVYTETKIAAEKIIIDSGLDYIIFRLSYCTSTLGLKFKPLMFEMPLDTAIEIIDARDLGLACINSLKNGIAWRRIFNIGGGQSCQTTFREYLNEMFKIMGLGRDFLPETAFAKNGFHCGYYDTREEQSLLNFQRHDLNDWYSEVRKWIGYKRYLFTLVRWFAKKYLLHKSNYYKKNKLINKGN